MNFWQRAIKNVLRKKTKAILLLLTFFLIGNFVIVGLGVASAAKNAKILTRKKMRAVVKYHVNYEKIHEEGEKIEDEKQREEFYRTVDNGFTYKEITNLINDKRIKTANSLLNNSVYNADDGLDFVHLNNEAEKDIQQNQGKKSCITNEDGVTNCYYNRRPFFALRGNFFPSMIELEEKTYKIVDGRFYTQEEIDNKAQVVLITSALAKQNNLRVGDSIKLDFNQMGEDLEGIDPIRELKIIGIYDHNDKIKPGDENFKYISPSENPDNFILMPGTTLNYINNELQIKHFDEQAKKHPNNDYYGDPKNRPNTDKIYLSNVILLLNDPLDVDNFVKEKGVNLNKYRLFEVNNEDFKRFSKPMDTLNLYANFILWMVIINAVVIITLITALTLKTREYEIGVLLSMGTSKLKIVSQFFLEIAIVAIIGFTISIFSGALTANKIGQKVLDYQIINNDLQKDKNKDDNDLSSFYERLYDNDYSTKIELDDVVKEYNVKISPLIVGEIYVTGLAIVLVSTLIPSLMIMRFNPKRILMSQN